MKTTTLIAPVVTALLCPALCFAQSAAAEESSNTEAKTEQVEAEPTAAASTEPTTTGADSDIAVTSSTTTLTQADGVTPGPRKGLIGLSFGFPAGGAPTAGASYFLSDKLALKGDVGLDIGKAGGGDFLAGISLEGGARIYLAQVGRLTPFVQPGLFLAKGAGPGDFGDLLVIQANGGIGAEYWFTENLTASALTGVGLRFADGFDTIKFATGTSGIYVNLYW